MSRTATRRRAARPAVIASPHNASPEALDHLVALIAAIRPQWDSGLVRIVLLSHRLQVDASDLAIAALRAARNPEMPGPKSIGWRGPHWDGASTLPPAIATRERCDVCSKPEQRCISERIGIDDDHPYTPKAAP